MAIFETINEAERVSPVVRKERQWVQLGLEYQEAKKKGVTSKAFAESKGLNPSTFSRSLSRYATQIKLAKTIKTLQDKPKNKLSQADKKLLMVNSFRSSIRDKIRNDGAATNNKSAKWFAETLKTGIRGHKVSKPMPGKVYAYIYDAKHKDTLPFWDKYPLIIYLGLGTQGSTQLMYGLNMHYIPPKARQQLLEDLLKQYANTSTITNKTKLKINWSNVKGYAGADKMIKAYLPGNIKGPMVEIKPDDWANVVLMPLQQFMSKGKRYSSSKVWSS